MKTGAGLPDRLKRGLEVLTSAGMPPVCAPAQDQLLALLDLLHKWNRVYNLTAVRDKSKMVERHLLDSLVMSRWLPASRTTSAPNIIAAACAASGNSAATMNDGTGASPTTNASTAIFDVMDIGTGAGLPVLPLAIVRPDLSFLSIESNGKKTRFQQQVLLELGINNVRVAQQRVESVQAQAHTVLARAFTAPADFLRIAESLCVDQGTVLVMLGQAEKLPTTVAPNYELIELVAVDVPGTESARHVALCRRQVG